jgi:CTP synthase
VKIALVCKYVELNDAYYSVREALYHAALYNDRSLEMLWVQSEDLDRVDTDSLLRTAQGIIVPGGFGVRGIEGMVKAARYARENDIPYFGLCLGLQVMVIEFARYVLNSNEPNSTEFNTKTSYPVIDYMLEQKKIMTKGATMRLGNYPCKLIKGSLAAKAYKQSEVQERHRHRLEFNNEYREPLGKAGMIFSGVSPDDNLVEICELKDHPWMLGCQFHPEFPSRPGRPHPLFREFVGVAKDVLREGAQPPLLKAND